MTPTPQTFISEADARPWDSVTRPRTLTLQGGKVTGQIHALYGGHRTDEGLEPRAYLSTDARTGSDPYPVPAVSLQLRGVEYRVTAYARRDASTGQWCDLTLYPYRQDTPFREATDAARRTLLEYLLTALTDADAEPDGPLWLAAGTMQEARRTLRGAITAADEAAAAARTLEVARTLAADEWAEHALNLRHIGGTR